MASAKPRVVLVRGHQTAPWDLSSWEGLGDRYDVAFLQTRSNRYDVDRLPLRALPARTLRDALPTGRLGDLAGAALRDRYRGVDEHLAGAAIVHAEELSYWFSADVARRKSRHGYKLVQTVWETLPLLDSYRNRHARAYRREVLAATDLFLAATDRAAAALVLEGVPRERIEVSPPGIDTERFTAAARAAEPPPEHVLVSPGRLAWEKGHQDAIRALAAIRRGLVEAPGAQPRLLIVGEGGERERLLAHAAELGVGDAVEIRGVPYDEMPAVFAGASCMVLASLPSAGCMLHPLDVPHCFWEEQFGLVLPEAMAAGLPLVVSSSGAVPEVAGAGASYFAAGDWLGLARALAEGPLARPPGERAAAAPEVIERYSQSAAADRLAAAYDGVRAGAGAHGR